MTTRPLRPRIIVIHGAVGSASQMQPVAEALASLGDTETLELPGHGETKLATGVTFGMTTFAEAIASAVQARQERRTYLFGYSMGGYAALLAAAQHGEGLPCSGIATLGTKFAWTPEVAAQAARWLDPAAMRAKVPAFADALETRHAGVGGADRVLRDTAALLLTLGQTPLLTPAVLQRVRVPVRVCAGTRDDTVTPEECRDAARAMPDGRYIAIEGAPHPIERVPVDAVVDIMRALIDAQ